MIHSREGELFKRKPDPELLDIERFNATVIDAYNRGVGEDELPADDGVARSLIPPGTGVFRDFSYIAPEIPTYDVDKCVGCMECVTECPDTAILGKVVKPEVLEQHLGDKNGDGELLRRDWGRTKKYWDAYEKKGKPGGLFGIFIDPTIVVLVGSCDQAPRLSP